MGTDKRTMKFFNWVKESVDVAKKNLSLIGKSCGWFTLTLIVGLCQIWIILFVNVVQGNAGIPLQQLINEFIVDGILLFFSIVLISSLMIDHYLFGKTPLDFKTKFMFSLFPLFLIVCCAILFVICYLKDSFVTPIDLEIIALSELAILAVTAIYAIVIKLDYLKSL
jgi:hypothetical protein